MEIKKNSFILDLVEDVVFLSFRLKTLAEVKNMLYDFSERSIPLMLIVKDFTFSPQNLQKLSVVIKGEHRTKVTDYLKEKKLQVKLGKNKQHLLIMEAPALRKFSGIIYDIIEEMDAMKIKYKLCSNSEIKIMFVVENEFSKEFLEELNNRLKKKWGE
jgi:aspartokinase